MKAPRLITLPLALLVASVMAPTLAADPSGWPTVALPSDVQRFNVGSQLDVNGTPMRIEGFVSRANLPEVLAWFRKSMGEPLVENTVGAQRVLGRQQGGHYLTVQLEALSAGQGTRGLVAVTDMKAASDARDDTRAEIEQWLSQMPAGSRLVNNMKAQDGGKLSRYMVFVNELDEPLNAGRIKSIMRDLGFVMERESRIDEAMAQKLPARLADGRSLFFKAQGKEAMAVVSRDDKGRTIVVLNTITTVERIK